MTSPNGVHHDDAEHAGEVIESSTTEFLAQARQLDAAPPFGSFVQVATDEGMTIVGVVAHVQTGGIDPGARAIMRGHDEVRDELIYQENPDLPLVLRTTFRALVVGFSEGGSIYQFLPPRPARLHYSVTPSTPAAVRSFTDAGFEYLGALLTGTEVPTDELLAANIRYTAALRGEPRAFLERAGRELAQLLHGDYARLTAIVRRCVQPLEVAT
jgi:hypothetical protein